MQTRLLVLGGEVEWGRVGLGVVERMGRERHWVKVGGGLCGEEGRRACRGWETSCCTEGVWDSIGKEPRGVERWSSWTEMLG